VTAKLVNKVLRSGLAVGDPNVRLLLVVIAEEDGNPQQKDPDGWIRLGIREIAGRVGCDHGTVLDLVERAEKLGLRVDRPGEKRRMGYKLPEQLVAGGHQIAGQASGGATPPVEEGGKRRSGGTTPPDLVAPHHHDPPVTTGGGAATRVAAGSGRPASQAGAVEPVGSLQKGVAEAPRTRPDAGEDVAAPGWEEDFESREDEERIKRERAAQMLVAWDSRASPDPHDNGSQERKGVRVINEVDLWEEAPLPKEELDPAEEEIVKVERHLGLDVVLVRQEDAAA
jgi:hypothetical protein